MNWNSLIGIRAAIYLNNVLHYAIVVQMKKSGLILFNLFICLSLHAFPFSESCHIVNSNVSIDFFTRASLFSDSVWYSTIMPSYNIGYEFNLINDNNKFHSFSVNTRYFSGNRFRLNSVELDKGELSIHLVNTDLEYLRYLQIAKPFSFIIGCLISPRFSYFGQRIAPGSVLEIKDFIICTGPVFGFSLYKPDFFEFSSLFDIMFGLPVYSKIKYAGGDTEKLNHFSLNGRTNNEACFIIRRIKLGLSYNFNFDINIDTERGTGVFVIEDTNMVLNHSISFVFGVVFK
jgi:hypothetical protein